MGLLVEMELEGLGEFLFRVSGRGVFFAVTEVMKGSWRMELMAVILSERRSSL